MKTLFLAALEDVFLALLVWLAAGGVLADLADAEEWFPDPESDPEPEEESSSDPDDEPEDESAAQNGIGFNLVLHISRNQLPF